MGGLVFLVVVLGVLALPAWLCHMSMCNWGKCFVCGQKHKPMRYHDHWCEETVPYHESCLHEIVMYPETATNKQLDYARTIMYNRRECAVRRAELVSGAKAYQSEL